MKSLFNQLVFSIFAVISGLFALLHIHNTLCGADSCLCTFLMQRISVQAGSSRKMFATYTVIS